MFTRTDGKDLWPLSFYATEKSINLKELVREGLRTFAPFLGITDQVPKTLKAEQILLAITILCGSNTLDNCRAILVWWAAIPLTPSLSFRLQRASKEASEMLEYLWIRHPCYVIRAWDTQ